MAFMARAAALAARAWQSQGGSTAPRQLAANGGQQLRAMGGGGGHAAHHSNPNDYVTYAGLTLKKPPSGEYALSKAIGATMWFWVFYMTYHNWDHKTKGLPAIFEAEGLDDDDAHGHH